MSAVVLRFADGNHDARRLAGLEDYYDLIRLGASEVGSDEFVAAAGRSLNDWRAPLDRTILDPTLELLGDAPQQIAAHRVLLAVRAKKTDDPLGLLERLDQSVEQDAIEAPIAKADAVVVMLEKGVHGITRVVDASELTPSTPYPIGRLVDPSGDCKLIRVFLRRFAAAWR